jgi:hypothetical protein
MADDDIGEAPEHGDDDGRASERDDIGREAYQRALVLKAVGERLEKMAENQEATAVVLAGLASDVKRVDESQEILRRLLRRGFWALALVVVMLAGLVVLGVLNRATLTEARTASTNAEESTRLIVECSTPSPSADDIHECFEQGVRRTNDAISQIIAGVRESTTTTTVAP